jgi:hypothetical protein
VPELKARVPEQPSQLDRCFLDPEQKRRLRRVGDRIGLASAETVIS